MNTHSPLEAFNSCVKDGTFYQTPELTTYSHSLIRRMLATLGINISKEDFCSMYAVESRAEAVARIEGAQGKDIWFSQPMILYEPNAIVIPGSNFLLHGSETIARKVKVPPADIIEMHVITARHPVFQAMQALDQPSDDSQKIGFRLGEEIGHFVRSHIKGFSGKQRVILPEDEERTRAATDEFYGFLGRKLLQRACNDHLDRTDLFGDGSIGTPVLLTPEQRQSNDPALTSKQLHERGYSAASAVDIERITRWQAFFGLDTEEVTARFFASEPDYSDL